ncbi:hypothetical protein ACEPAH_5334 [Sanghuangporus vaninii]
MGHSPRNDQLPDVFPSNITSPSSNPKTDALGFVRRQEGSFGVTTEAVEILRTPLIALHICDKARIHFFQSMSLD